MTKSILAVALFVVAAGCGGAAPPPKTGADVVSAAETKQTECDAAAAKFTAVDDAVKGAKGLAAGRALVPALEKMSAEFKATPMKTPGLDKAVTDVSTEADSFAAKMKELNSVFDEMEQISEGLEAWQQKVEQVAQDFDVACNKAPKAQCENLSTQVTKIPHLEGDQFATYATELEAFLITTGKVPVRDAKLKAALNAMLSVLGESIKPMRRLAELLEEPKKLDPAADGLKAKFNQVREICGLPPRT